jgi:hypothetical protein
VAEVPVESQSVRGCVCLSRGRPHWTNWLKVPIKANRAVKTPVTRLDRLGFTHNRASRANRVTRTHPPRANRLGLGPRCGRCEHLDCSSVTCMERTLGSVTKCCVTRGASSTRRHSNNVNHGTQGQENEDWRGGSEPDTCSVRTASLAGRVPDTKNS